MCSKILTLVHQRSRTHSACIRLSDLPINSVQVSSDWMRQSYLVQFSVGSAVRRNSNLKTPNRRLESKLRLTKRRGRLDSPQGTN